MSLLDQYKNYRNLQVELHTKILDECINDDDFLEAGNEIGVLKNNQIVVKYPNEEDFIYDFLIYENRNDGERALNEYINKGIETREEEKVLLNAMTQSVHSLYSIIDVDKEKNMLVLNDLLTNKVIHLIDFGFSQNANNNLLLYCRLMDLGEFYMTSGLAFLFKKDHKDYLLKKSRKLMKKINSGNDSKDRLLAYFWLNRKDGIPTLLEQV
ncbi:hypothetical protein PU629_13435 [Pullulanibacillus sp. KACC 23026]|uniref:hypothetical protein n=1 Tax=Pullulanibacillus sp. KACC 23026 TaxID=3028315 RepID=UPI0023B12E8A|nr:hypothetical protein [Pullulanibacillus sp. KACC 23026]WEG11170.1 hypothetical protein PU629_13435 [Pullulanibacillus sp. KACC 23026]